MTITSEKMIYDAFISYSKEDGRLAHQIAEALSKEGLRVFDIEAEIRVGESISDVISDALENSKHFILLISPNYIASRLTNFEMGVALGQKLAEPSKRIFPILVQNVDHSSIPTSLAHISSLNAEDFSPEEIALKLKEAIECVKSPS